jgi:outer membrane receptor protein involved in Fe transport
VVTAEKQSRSLQETSTSIAVFSEDDLQRVPGLDSLLDLVGHIGNVTSDGKAGSLPAVRGVDGTGPARGANAFLGGTRSRLAYQLDGRPLGFNETVYGNSELWDVAQVEVLRGPQSTLQGRNAIAGTIAIHTKDPTFDWQGGMRLVGGDYSQRQGSVYLSGPLVDDQIAFRVAYDRSEYDSYLSSPLLYPGVDDPEHYTTTTARAKLLIQPNALPGFKTVIAINRMEFEGPQTEIVVHPFNDHIALNGYMPRFAPSSTSAVAATTWELSDSLTFENTLSYSDYSVSRYSFPGDGNAQIDGDEWVIEPRLRYASSDGRLSALFGVYFYRAQQDEYLDLIGGMNFEDSTANTAAFTELSYKITERLELTAGGRYERENRDRQGGNFFVVDLDKTYSTFLPKLGLAFSVTPDVTVGAVVSRSYNGGGAAFTFQPPFVNYEYEPEYVTNYETYWRAKLLDGRLQLTGNLFYSDYEDFQLEFDINPDPAIYSFVVRNAEKVYAYGSELGVRWLAARGLTLSADAGLQWTKIDKYPGNSVEGNELPRAPHLNGGVGISYAHSIGLDAALDARYSDWFYSDVINRTNERTDPYWSVNAQAGYTFGKVRVFGVVQNLFDGDAVTGVLRGATQAGDNAYIQWPRTYKAGFTVSF